MLPSNLDLTYRLTHMLLLWNINQFIIETQTFFLQNETLCGLIANVLGRNDFRNKGFSSHCNLVRCSNACEFAAIFNVGITWSRFCKPKSKVPFHTSELYVDMIAEIIDLFSLDGGTVLERCAGLITVAILALKTRRKCLCVEKNKDYFNDALDRLCKFFPSTLWNKHVGLIPNSN